MSSSTAERGGPPGAESRARSACGSENRLWQGGAYQHGAADECGEGEIQEFASEFQ